MPKERIITAIDVGSSKICTIVASVTDRKVSVIGNSSVPSLGIDRGVVNDIDKAVEAISNSLEKAEKMAGHAISRAIITVNGQHIESENSTGVVAVSDPEGEISAQDVLRVNEAAQAISIPSNREIIHVLPRDYVVDSTGNIKNPEGMSGIRLEVEAHIIHGSSTVIKNLVKSVRQVGVEVSDFIYTGLASSISVLTDTEKELGTVLLDIGGRTTSCILYQNGSPLYSFVVPIGGKHLTGDIAVGLRCSLDSAELIKQRHSSGEESKKAPSSLGLEENIKPGDLYIGDIDPDLTSVPKKFLDQIIHDRLEEIYTLVLTEIKKSGFIEKLPAGAIITGGTGETRGVVEVAKKVLNMPVRVGFPKGITGLIDEIEGPAYSACVGSILYKLENSNDESDYSNVLSGVMKSGFLKKIVGALASFFKSLVP